MTPPTRAAVAVVLTSAALAARPTLAFSSPRRHPAVSEVSASPPAAPAT
eukprot:CAMPEP_0183308290 /NCGR_PEP_ID=MMETSP0160_2-20130417/21127_1 /TAXON_ID=2839 ORGANISM="Odontella Sinensis, Strain Grunow 1884" /NCGR_SAMPLE_ID=MMETSP0160_2 /ASSEMBLY_ACC=CAM_ASM_000250 /LENGTH=48 /DNA_ID= /DNA_START= /DNA_END= /DNA_ORIENTATION=